MGLPHVRSPRIHPRERRPQNSWVRPGNGSVRPTNSRVRITNSLVRPTHSRVRPTNSRVRPTHSRVRLTHSWVRPPNSRVRPRSCVSRPRTRAAAPRPSLFRDPVFPRRRRGVLWGRARGGRGRARPRVHPAGNPGESAAPQGRPVKPPRLSSKGIPGFAGHFPRSIG